VPRPRPRPPALAQKVADAKLPRVSPPLNTVSPLHAADRPDHFRGRFRTDLMARALYAEGAGIARCLPAAVAVPADADDVPALARWAKRTGAALIPRGSGSSMAAGAVGPGVVVDLSRLTHLGAVNREARRIVTGAGALRGDIDRAARAVGLRFPVDPSSGAFCTIGGMVGANAAGVRTLRFGATRPWVLGVRCVFDDGSDAWIHRERPLPAQLPAVRRLVQALTEIERGVPSALLVHRGVRKESSGYGVASALAPGGHLIDLLVGSEGTLALFTQVELALTPVAGATATVLATFATLEAATCCAGLAASAGATACELLDRTFLAVAARGASTGVPEHAEAVLIAEVEGETSTECAGLLDALTRSWRDHGAITIEFGMDAAAEHALWALRHAASPILSQLAPRLRSMQFIEDGCVPPEHFPAYVRGVRATLDRFETLGVIFGHAGDAHAHVNPLVDTTAPKWRDRVHGMLDSVCELTAQLGGTLAGEHGDGRLRAPLLSRVWGPEALGAFAHVKDAADPSGVLNPGCKVARAGDMPFDMLRHDPEAPALPPEAAAVLAEIERTRDWSRFRLG